MFIKMIVGEGFRGAAEYAAEGAGQAAPQWSNMEGKNPRELSKEIAALRSARSGLRRAVGHIMLSHDPSDRRLTDDEFRRAIEIAREELGLENSPYAAWPHDETEHQHVHCMALLIDRDGNRVNDFQNWRKCERAARRIEKELGLKPPTPVPKEGRFKNGEKVKKVTEAARRRGMNVVIDPRPIWGAVQISVGPEDLAQRLKKDGLDVEFSRRETGEIYGWKIRPAGSEHAIKASSISRQLAWTNVEAEMNKSKQREGTQAPSSTITPAQADIARQAFDKARTGAKKQFDEAHQAGVSEHLIRMALALAQAMARLIESMFRLPKGSLGSWEYTPQAGPRAVHPTPAEGADLAALAQAQAKLAAHLNKLTESLKTGDMGKLPDMPDSRFKALREQLAAANREAAGNDQDDDEERRQARLRAMREGGQP